MRSGRDSQKCSVLIGFKRPSSIARSGSAKKKKPATAEAAASPAAARAHAAGSGASTRIQGAVASGGVTPAAGAAKALSAAISDKAAARAFSAAAAAGASAPPPSKHVDLAALCRGLPQHWKAYLDPGTGEPYYANFVNKETSWTRPPGSTAL